MSASIDRVANHDGEFKFDLDFTEGYKVNSLTARTAFEYAQAVLAALKAEKWRQAKQSARDLSDLLAEVYPSSLSKAELAELREYVQTNLCFVATHTHGDFLGRDDLDGYYHYERVLGELCDSEMITTLIVDWDFRGNGTSLDQLLRAIPDDAEKTVQPGLKLPLNKLLTIPVEATLGHVRAGLYIDASPLALDERYLLDLNLSSVGTLTTVQPLDNGNWTVRNAWFTHDDPEADAFVKCVTDSDSSVNEEEEATGIPGRLNQLVDFEIGSDGKIVQMRSSCNGYDPKTGEFVANYFMPWYINQELGVESYVPPIDWRTERRLRSEEA
ncbi:MAG: hypothetical protein ACTJG2_04065 [Candidatus Saccharimonadales bacterium]